MKSGKRVGAQFDGVMAGIGNEAPGLAAENTGKVGRPTVHTEPWVKPQMVMLQTTQDFLDDMAARMERAARPHHVIFDRSKLVRAMALAWQRSGLTMDGVLSEEELTEVFQGAFSQAKKVRA